ncbi:hypothetical protein [Pedobacter sp. ok626]|nr:hypothetical protein [Pedobacter sp. ok626]
MNQKSLCIYPERPFPYLALQARIKFIGYNPTKGINDHQSYTLVFQ